MKNSLERFNRRLIKQKKGSANSEIGHFKLSSQRNKKKKRAKISEKSPRDIQDTTKWTNIFIKGDTEKEEREKGGRKFI